MYIGVAVIKKHYTSLLRCLPSDHMITLGRLSQAIPLRDQTIDQIISCTDSTEANKKILHLLILMIENDNNLLDFCSAMEKILRGIPTALESLRNG